MTEKKKQFPKGKNTKSKKYRRALADYLDGRALKCVTERIDGVEELVGKGGAIIKKDGELLVYSSQDVIMRVNVDELEAWELMSLDGVVITAPDIEHGGEIRSVIAFYSYYREL